MSEFRFEPFPKIGRLNANAVITEKIDGTNAQLLFDVHGTMLVGSRKRPIVPEGTARDGAGNVVKGTDNFGFARWAFDNAFALFEFLGPGRHYGEWAGAGIQRTYGMDTKRFYLFNTARFGPDRQEIPYELSMAGLDVVPVLYDGPHGSEVTAEVMVELRDNGSRINNFTNPEGIIVYMQGIKQYYKMTFDYSRGKWDTK